MGCHNLFIELHYLINFTIIHDIPLNDSIIHYTIVGMYMTKYRACMVQPGAFLDRKHQTALCHSPSGYKPTDGVRSKIDRMIFGDMIIKHNYKI